MKNKDNNVMLEVKEVKEVNSVYEANELLQDGWVILKIFKDVQLCFQKVIVGSNKFEKVQPYDKYISEYIMGRLK